jgi:hypothetical protein
VLNHVHVLLHIIISSDSWECEGFVKNFPGVNSWWFFVKLISNFDGIFIVLDVEFSGELIHLPDHFISTDPESFIAIWLLSSESINNTIISLNFSLN